MTDSPFRVMVVDEDADIRYVVTSLLGLEFETVQAQNGLDALEKIDRYQPDLLVMEVNMPIMNGIACCRAIQKNEDFQHLPVFFMSASSDPELKRQAIKAGGKDYIEKPFQSAALIDIINNYLNKGDLSPAEKAYSVAQIAQIDASPLQAVSHDEVAVEEPDIGSLETQVPLEEEKVEGRKRRVFGKRPKGGRKTPPTPAPSPEADSKIDLPEPPKPDYGRVSLERARRREEEERQRREEEERKEKLRREAEEREKKQEVTHWPLAREEKPEVEPEKPAAKEAEPPVEKTAPPPTTPPKPSKKQPAKTGPTPAEILAQRRLGAIGKKPMRDKIKPRVLVLIDADKQLEICHSAMKGLAEFLPLEDPVEAVELIARFQPDVVMAGIRTRKYSGLQLAQMLRSNPRLSHVEILFVQGPQVEEQHLRAAKSLSKNPVVRMPVTEGAIRQSIQEIASRPTFQVREKKLGYGVYVKEVIRKAEQERARGNKEKEARSYEKQHNSLAKFMANELKGYKEPEGYEELLGIGRKEHKIQAEVEEI